MASKVLAQAPQVFPIASTPLTWKDTARNILTGKVSADWLNTLHKTVTVFHIVGLAISILSGYWFLAVVFSASIYIDKLTQRLIVDLRSHKNLNRQYMLENNVHKRNNSIYTKLNEAHKQLIEQHKKVIEAYSEENKTYKTNNAVHKKLLGELQAALTNYKSQMNALITDGKIQNDRAVKNLQNVNNKLSAQLTILTDLATKGEEKVDAQVEKLADLLEQVNAGSVTVLKKAEEAEKRVIAASKDLEKIEEQTKIQDKLIKKQAALLKKQEAQLDSLQEENAKLKLTTGDLQAVATDMNRSWSIFSRWFPTNTANKLNTATKQQIQATTSA